MFYLFDYFILQPYLKDLTINIHDFWNSEKSNAYFTTENYY